MANYDRDIRAKERRMESKQQKKRIKKTGDRTKKHIKELVALIIGIVDMEHLLIQIFICKRQFMIVVF